MAGRLAVGLALVCAGLVSCSNAPGDGVTVSPSQVALAPRGTVTFTATVSSAAAVAVTWSVQETGGGTVDASGFYTAPGSAGTFHVVATSAADPSKSGSAIVTVSVPASLTVSSTSLPPP